MTRYTDSSGGAEYSQKTLGKRATTVESVLVENSIDDSRITAEGIGESPSPPSPDEVREGCEQSRRMEIAVPAFNYQVEQ
ncbi:OmpA family protein [Vibrio coralliilyticus]|uniref:OmpA family protein n=1 Tax=Vibrio coralliilyticus TaxID=190893 RepID=UPI00148DED51|nr:OmpA family protein [Vibrio coralliilyticus]NOI28925.1 OmpA family protein [Vibrio coralliilyticus]NOI48162.1 OmpA family protein [Vibrio coralliilyticus]